MKTKIKTVIGRHGCRCNHSFGWSLRSKLLISILAGTLILISACSGGSGGGGGGKLSGTYETADGYTSFAFSGNKVTVKREGKVVADSTYEIKDGKLYYTYGETKMDADIKIEGNVLTIGVSKYTKK